VVRYRSKISGPRLDRIDLKVEVPALLQQDLTGRARGESSASVRERVTAARELALAREGKANFLLSTREIDRHCKPGARGEVL
jgi:magnesium chelatase family protein